MRTTALLLSPVLLVALTAQARADDAPAQAPAPAATPPAQTHVTLRADDAHAALEKQTGSLTPPGPIATELGFAGVSTWQTVCAAPSGVAVDPHGVYRVAGDGLVPSSSFSLGSLRDRVTLDSRSGNAFMRVGGVLLAAGGGAAAVLGGGSFVTALVLDQNGTGSPLLRDSLRYGGLAVAGAGVVAAALGVYLYFTNGTTVRTDSGMQVGSGPRVTPAGFTF
jgi:hypothetical protein